MAPDRPYTTQLQAGLGMVHETLDLLRLWQPGDSARALADRAIHDGLFARATARRARNIVVEMFAPRFMSKNSSSAKHLKYLAGLNHSLEDLVQLFFIYTARAHTVLREFVTDVYWPRYIAGATHVGRTEAEAFIHRGLNNGRMVKPWTESSIHRVAGYLLGCCSDFGLLGQANRSDRKLNNYNVRPKVAMYLIHDLHFAGITDSAIMYHEDWKLFGLEPREVTQQAKTLSHDRHFLIQSDTELIQITWKYHSMEECIDAIASR